jgi:hypothetical protein
VVADCGDRSWPCRHRLLTAGVHRGARRAEHPHTTAIGRWRSMDIWAASPAASTAPSFRPRPTGSRSPWSAARSSFGLRNARSSSDRSGRWPINASFRLPGSCRARPPAGAPRPRGPRQRLERLAAQRPEQCVHLLARRPPGPGPVVTGLLVWVLIVHRYDRHLHPCLLGLQENRSDGTPTTIGERPAIRRTFRTASLACSFTSAGCVAGGMTRASMRRRTMRGRTTSGAEASVATLSLSRE